MNTSFEWDKSIKEILKEKTGGSKGLLFLANEAEKLMQDYVPATQEEILSQNTTVYLEDNHAVIHYLSPYAHYQYEGILYVDPITGKGAFTNGEGKFWSRPKVPKKPTKKKLKHNQTFHPFATSHWDKAMMVAKKDELIRSYETYLRNNI